MNTEQSDGGAAFPRQHKRWDADDMRWVETEPEEGMTLRDYFAAKGMHALLPLISDNGRFFDSTKHEIAAKAYEIADAMLKARAL